MSGISHNSSDGTGRLKISNSTSTYLTLGYTGSSQLDFNLPTNYGSSGQGLVTDGTGGLSWGEVSGGAGTNGTSGTSGSSGVGTSGTSGTSGTTPPANTTAYWFGETTHYQMIATGSSFIGLTVSNETNFSGLTAAVFDFDGTYLIEYSINVARKLNTVNYTHTNNQFIFLKYNGATFSSSINVINPHQLLGSGGLRPPAGQPYANNTSFCIISATANSTLELWSYFDESLEIAGTQSGPAAKMSISKIF